MISAIFLLAVVVFIVSLKCSLSSSAGLKKFTYQNLEVEEKLSWQPVYNFASKFEMKTSFYCKSTRLGSGRVVQAELNISVIINSNCNHFLFTKLFWPGDSEEIYRSTSQAATYPLVYHTR